MLKPFLTVLFGIDIMCLPWQVLDASTGDWYNSSISVTASLSVLINPVAPTGTVYSQLRYASNLWPQCALYSSSNQIPLDVFILNISMGADANTGHHLTSFRSSKGMQPAAPALHRGSISTHTSSVSLTSKSAWTEWKGQKMPSLPPPGIAAATPPRT